MRPCLLAGSALVLILAWTTLATAQEDEARALILRAIKAQGGDTRYGMPMGQKARIKGKLPVVEDISFAGQAWIERPGRHRMELQMELQGMEIKVVQVFDGVKGWVEMNGMIEEMTGDMLKSAQQGAHADRVSSLGTLLKDKEFNFTTVAETKVNNRPAVGVKVSSKDQPDVTLWFDKETGLTAKVEYRVLDSTVGKDVLQETYPTDYRELSTVAADENIVAKAKVGADAKSLLEFFRKQTLTDEHRAQIKDLIKKLGDDSFQEREKATTALIAFGANAVSFLREVQKESQDAEVVRRATACLEQIDRGTGPEVTLAVIRLLAIRKPEGAVETLLAYIPSAGEAEVVREVKSALLLLHPHPALEQALDDKDPVRRAAAAAALGKDNGAFEKEPGRRLPVTGLKRPAKIIVIRDGKKYMEWEEYDVQFFNKLDDRLFQKK